MELVRPEVEQSHLEPQIILVEKCCQTAEIFPELSPFTILDMMKSDQQTLAFTGVESLTAFKAICDSIELLETLWYPMGRRVDLVLEGRILLTLLKLKINCTFQCLGALFNISRQQAARYFYKTLHLLYMFFKRLIPWPSRQEIRRNLPKHFDKYPDTRVVIDCTEFAVACCRCLSCRLRCYSHYKGAHTLKVMIGISPAGLITFLSQTFGGRTSDKFLFLQSNILKKVEPGDSIMCDKGFLITEECKALAVNVIQPPFLKDKNKFSPQEAADTYYIAHARVHVERAIQRLKTYKILSDKISWLMVPQFDEIISVISALVNLSHPILASDKFQK